MHIQKTSKLQVAALVLRLSLAVVFLYAGWSALKNPGEWFGYVPQFATKLLDIRTVLKIMAVYELLLGAALVAGKYMRYVGLLCTLTLAGILVANLSQLIVTFRDFGLLGEALALTVLAW